MNCLRTAPAVRCNRDLRDVADATYSGSHGRLNPEPVLDFIPAAWFIGSRDRSAMRRQLKNFLPIVMVALLVQIFAPIGACWAASIVASDPLSAAVICHGNGDATSGTSDPASHRAHDGCCSVCSVLQTGAPVDAPDTVSTVAVSRIAAPVVWIDLAVRPQQARAGSHAQARAPPTLS